VSVVGEVSDIEASVFSSVQRQNRATENIREYVGNSSSGMTNVSLGIAEVETAAQEAGGASNHILDSLSILTNQVDVLQAESSSFLVMVRSG